MLPTQNCNAGEMCGRAVSRMWKKESGALYLHESVWELVVGLSALAASLISRIKTNSHSTFYLNDFEVLH